MKKATVIGLGQMGSTLARLLLDSGYQVTVWNRTASKADALVARGAVLAPTALAAVSASPVVVVCVHDYAAARDILEASSIEAAMAGKVLVQLTSGSPAEAREAGSWAGTHGSEYLDGAIQAAPSQMGRADTPILFSGAESTYRENESLLRVFGGGLSHLGTDPGAAAAIDLATLSYIYGASIGFFHGARIAEAEGFPVDRYGALVAGIGPTFADFLKYEGEVIQSGNFEVGESPLSISVEATERIALAARASGINDEFPSFASALFRRGADAGLGGEEFAAIIKVLRAARAAPPEPATPARA